MPRNVKKNSWFVKKNMTAGGYLLRAFLKNTVFQTSFFWHFAAYQTGLYICLLSTSIHKERSLSVSPRLRQFTVEKNVLEFLNDLKFILYLNGANGNRGETTHGMNRIRGETTRIRSILFTAALVMPEKYEVFLCISSWYDNVTLSPLVAPVRVTIRSHST
jgi:hypothetical protein